MLRQLRSAMRAHPAAAERILSYLQILAGCFFGAAAYPLFLTPCSIAPGGITGVATILNRLFHWPVGTVSLLLNIPLFLIGYRAMGGIFAFRSLVATFVFSLLIDLLPFRPMTADPLLATLYGGVLLGAGLGLIMRGGATTGGSDMVARMVNKKLPFISTGAFLFIIDCLVVIAAGIFIGTSEALYAMINIFLSAKIMDSVIIGFTGSKACYIISDRWEPITQRIISELGRGVTQLVSRGGYTGAERLTLLCVISRSEVMALKRVISEEDERAFIIIVEANETIGDGFSAFTQ